MNSGRLSYRSSFAKPPGDTDYYPSADFFGIYSIYFSALVDYLLTESQQMNAKGIDIKDLKNWDLTIINNKYVNRLP